MHSPSGAACLTMCLRHAPIGVHHAKVEEKRDGRSGISGCAGDRSGQSRWAALKTNTDIFTLSKILLLYLDVFRYESE